jgi:putative PIN family toxin of toxin-antitoxin system
MSRKIRAVFDLNVILSGIGWRGVPYKCLEAVRDGTVIGFVAAPALIRLKQLLVSKLGYSEQQAVREVDDLKSYLRVVEITGSVRDMTGDPEDDMVLECAIKADADYIISGDKKHLLPLGQYAGIPILSPPEFLAKLAL